MLLKLLNYVDTVISDGPLPDYLHCLVICAMGLWRETVLFKLLEETLRNQKDDYHKASRFIERLAQYGTALYTLKSIVKERIKFRNPIFHCSVDVVFTSPRSPSIELPSLDKLKEWALQSNDPLVIVSADRKWEYEQQITGFRAKEHCEIQLVRFYLENSEVFPVLSYFGTSKSCCFMCDLFLKGLQHPSRDKIQKLGDTSLNDNHFVFSVRGTHGEVCSRRLPSIGIRATKEVQDRVSVCVDAVLHEVETQFRRRMWELMQRPMGGGSPAWSEDGEDNDDSDDSDSLEDIFSELF